MTGILTTTASSKDKKRTEIKMPDSMRTILKEMYLIRSYSGFEEPLRRYIMAFLDNLNIPYVNFNGNILGFNHPGMPLFGAHMDMVNTESYKLKGSEAALDSNHVFTVDKDTNIRLYRDSDKKCQTSLGADDKNGIWIIMMLLAQGRQINFAFFHSEEVGHIGSGQVASDKELGEFIESCKYGIIIDRRNHWDIIGYDNKYCMGLDDRLSAFAKSIGMEFKPARGSISDADSISPLIECVNLSCGYYEPHTSKEYTNLNELWDTYLLCEQMLDNFDYTSVSASRMQDFKGCKSPYSKYTYTTTVTYDDDDKWANYYNNYNKTNTKDEKKDSAKKKTSKTIVQATTGDTDTDTDTTTDELLEECMDRGVSYDIDTGTWVVPLVENPDKIGAKADDILETFTCPECGTSVTLLQQSIDALYMDYYNKNIDQCVGICEHCHKFSDIKKDIDYLM